ncbi:MAG: hypothetical protein P4L69_07160 [Desulfosporosinus sp.]|nr:hypothetical protein [Desulfosporosinus sp.]
MANIAIAQQIALLIVQSIEADPNVAKDVAKITKVITDAERILGPQLIEEVGQYVTAEEKKVCSCLAGMFLKKKK